ncbi:MAG: PAS domain-containing protein [Verrucomicrobia bacterium]|nr:PAS domain-containing protein [Cytophagales bacterium]
MKLTSFSSSPDLNKSSPFHVSLSKLTTQINAAVPPASFIHFTCLLVICINPLLGFLNFWHSNILYGVTSLFALCVLILNKSGWFNFARMGLLVGLNLLIFTVSATGAYQIFVVFCFLIAVVATLILFSKKQRWEIGWGIAIAVFMLVVAIGSGYRFPVFEPQADTIFDTPSIINIVCTSISVVVATYYLFSLYTKTENHLKSLLTEVQTHEQAIREQNQQLIALNQNLVQSQEDLIKNHTFLNTIVDNLPVLLTVKDVRNLKLIRVNKAVENLTKFDEKELIMKKNDDIFPIEQADTFTHNDRIVLEQGIAVEQEEYMTDKLNKTHIVNTKRVPVYGANGEQLYLLSISEDITQRKRSEQVLKNTLEELKVRNNELDNYVYRVSHDLRSPLCSVLGLVGLIKLENDMDIIKEYTKMIEQTVVKSDYFIQSILDHSKMLHADLQVVEINFRNLIEECFSELKYIVSFENIELNIEETGFEKFYGDEFRIATLIRNIISNALKYADPQKIDKFITCYIHSGEKQITINIEDNGIGIEEQYIHRIFDMFFRGSERSVGSGIGLYIVKQALEKLEGQISVKSKLGTGTTFTIVLPNRKNSYLLL